jgi:hypothetical protein
MMVSEEHPGQLAIAGVFGLALTAMTWVFAWWLLR